MKKLLIATAFTFFCVSAFAAPSDSVSVQPAMTATQHTATANLDVAKVISVSPPQNDCNVGVERMVYLDHSGTRHSLSYDVVDTGNGCNS